MSQIPNAIIRVAEPDGCPQEPCIAPSALSVGQLTDQARDALTAQSITLRAVLDAVVTPLAETVTAQGAVLDKVTARLERAMRDCCQRQERALISIANDLRAIASNRVAEDGIRTQLARDLLPQQGVGGVPQGQQPAFPGPQLPPQGPQFGQPGQILPLPIPLGQPAPGDAEQPQEPARQEEEEPEGACGIGLGARAQRPDNVVAIVPWGKREGKQAALISDCGQREMKESAWRAESVAPVAEFFESGDLMAVLKQSIGRNGAGGALPAVETFPHSTAPLPGF